MRNPEGKFFRHLEDWSITESPVADGGQVTDIVFLPLPLYQGSDDLFQISRGPWWGGGFHLLKIEGGQKVEGNGWNPTGRKVMMSSGNGWFWAL
jgi:hypothetical protein